MLSPTQVLAPASLSSRRYSSTTSFVHLRPQGDCLSSTQETGAKTGMGKDRPKVKLSKGDKRGLAHVGRLLPCADHFPVSRHLLQRLIWGKQASTQDSQAGNVATVRCWCTCSLGSLWG